MFMLILKMRPKLYATIRVFAHVRARVSVSMCVCGLPLYQKGVVLFASLKVLFLITLNSLYMEREEGREGVTG